MLSRKADKMNLTVWSAAKHRGLNGPFCSSSTADLSDDQVDQPDPVGFDRIL